MCIWFEVDGGCMLEYLSQFMGWYCYMVYIVVDGCLFGVEDGFLFVSCVCIEFGMMFEQVSCIFGIECMCVFFLLSGEDVWDWIIEFDQLSSYGMCFNVYFKDGCVVRMMQSMVFLSWLFLFGD